MDLVQIVLVASIAALTIFLVVIGFQAFFLLKELRKTIKRINPILSDTKEITGDIKVPVDAASNLLTGITSGAAMVNLFKNRDRDNSSKPHVSTFLAGVILADTLTHLFGTKGGQRLKEEILKEGGQLLGNVGEEIKEVKEKVEDAGEKVVENLVEAAGDVKVEPESVKAEPESVKEQASKEVLREAPQPQKKSRHFFFRKKPRAES